MYLFLFQQGRHLLTPHMTLETWKVSPGVTLVLLVHSDIWRVSAIIITVSSHQRHSEHRGHAAVSVKLSSSRSWLLSMTHFQVPSLREDFLPLQELRGSRCHQPVGGAAIIHQRKQQHQQQHQQQIQRVKVASAKLSRGWETGESEHFPAARQS